MTDEDYKRAEVIQQDLMVLTYCKISPFASKELKKDFNDWVKEKRTSLQDEFDNL